MNIYIYIYIETEHHSIERHKLTIQISAHKVHGLVRCLFGMCDFAVAHAICGLSTSLLQCRIESTYPYWPLFHVKQLFEPLRSITCKESFLSSNGTVR